MDFETGIRGPSKDVIHLVRTTARGRCAAARSGNAHHNYERYLALAREATVRGDPIEAENCHQHAEHYFRVRRLCNLYSLTTSGLRA